MATRLPAFGLDNGATYPFMPGGSPTLPPTAYPTDPRRISPMTFSGDSLDLGSSEFVPPASTPPPAAGGGYHYDPSTTGAASQPFIGLAEDPNFEAQLTALYHKYGRADPTPQEMLAHAGNPGGLAAVEQMLAASSAAAGPAPKAAPTTPRSIQIGTDAQSQLIDAGLADIIKRGGQSDSSKNLMAQLMEIINSGGVTHNSEAELNRARDEEATAFTGQLADARGALASRGVASLPGVEQGSEVGAIKRLTESLAPIYADTVSGIETHAADAKTSSLMNALSLATGLSDSDSRNLLGALGAGTDRQSALSQIALRSLEDDQQWNEFLATYGLQKDQVAAQIESGNIQSLIPMLTAFLQLAQQGAQGYIGNH